jgi:hypothetical protein
VVADQRARHVTCRCPHGWWCYGRSPVQCCALPAARVPCMATYPHPHALHSACQQSSHAMSVIVSAPCCSFAYRCEGNTFAHALVCTVVSRCCRARPKSLILARPWELTSTLAGFMSARAPGVSRYCKQYPCQASSLSQDCMCCPFWTASVSGTTSNQPRWTE